ncbi:alkyl sulfatase C-terminal domain-containing protein [Streptomyces sp. JW3]|uniref:alkyl sulfatase C-terminal domain-containing protein n=1 Tax=Streptomyces sp. JW3 TaxID=3456955 RepID=UPI003FA431BD
MNDADDRSPTSEPATPELCDFEDADRGLVAPPRLADLLTGRAGLDGIEHSGDPAMLRTLLSVLDQPVPDFAIVTP